MNSDARVDRELPVEVASSECLDSAIRIDTSIGRHEVRAPGIHTVTREKRRVRADFRSTSAINH